MPRPFIGLYDTTAPADCSRCGKDARLHLEYVTAPDVILSLCVECVQIIVKAGLSYLESRDDREHAGEGK